MRTVYIYMALHFDPPPDRYRTKDGKIIGDERMDTCYQQHRTNERHPMMLTAVLSEVSRL